MDTTGWLMMCNSSWGQNWQLGAPGEYVDLVGNNPLDTRCFVLDTIEPSEKVRQKSEFLPIFGSEWMQVQGISSIETIGCHAHVAPSNSIG